MKKFSVTKDFSGYVRGSFNFEIEARDEQEAEDMAKAFSVKDAWDINIVRNDTEITDTFIQEI